MVTQMSYRNLQELVAVKGFMGHTRYFSGPMQCLVPRVVGRKSDLTTAPLNSFMVTQIYCMSFQELVVHRLVKVPWHLTVIQMLFTIMDYVFAPVMTAGMLEILVEDFYSKRCLILQLQYLFHLPIKCVVDTLNNMFIICCMKWMHI